MNKLSNFKFKRILDKATPYLINTLFDAIFTILGILVGSSLGESFDIHLIVGTMITTSISLGVSSGYSVYEAELIQEEKRISEIEEALLTDLEGTVISQRSDNFIIFSSLIVFLTPLLACVINLFPIALNQLGIISNGSILNFIIFLDLVLIFFSGLFFGGEKRLLKGVRMTVLGSMVFIFGYLLKLLF